MTQYLVRVRDKNKTSFLDKFGSVVHISKLSSLVILESRTHLIMNLKKHPNVMVVRKTNTFDFA